VVTVLVVCVMSAIAIVVLIVVACQSETRLGRRLSHSMGMNASRTRSAERLAEALLSSTQLAVRLFRSFGIVPKFKVSSTYSAFWQSTPMR
jgi:preprotein translocase subunit SecG